MKNATDFSKENQQSDIPSGYIIHQIPCDWELPGDTYINLEVLS